MPNQDPRWQSVTNVWQRLETHRVRRQMGKNPNPSFLLFPSINSVYLEKALKNLLDLCKPKRIKLRYWQKNWFLPSLQSRRKLASCEQFLGAFIFFKCNQPTNFYGISKRVSHFVRSLPLRFPTIQLFSLWGRTEAVSSKLPSCHCFSSWWL